MEKEMIKRKEELETISDFRDLLDKTVSRYPDNIAYKYKKKPEDTEVCSITYVDFCEEVKNLSTYLLSLGLQGKRVAVIGNNRYEWCASYFAVTTGGMVVVPLDKALPDNEIESLIIRSGAEAIIFEDKYTKAILETKKNEKCQLKHLICMDTPKEETILNYHNVVKEGKSLIEKGNHDYEKIQIDANKMSIMLFTSGTTNIAKAVMLSQRNICSQIEVIPAHVKLYPTDTLLSFLPLHHTFECTITFLYGFYTGTTVAFCDGLKYVQKNLKDYQVTVFVAVPLMLETMYKRIQKAIEEQGKTNLINMMTKVSNFLLTCKIDARKLLFKPVLEQLGGKLRVVLYGAAPMDKSTIIGYNNLGIDLVQGYGLTETSPVIAAETDYQKRAGSIGVPLVNVEVKIDDPDQDGIGEIMTKGPNVMLGYYENEEATKKAFKDGWFLTGDYGYIDSEGYIFVTGRKSDVIVLRNGKNIYPQEVEFLINKIPYIAESMVYARNKSKSDTLLGAKIVYDKELIQEALGEKTEKEYKQEIWKRVKEINQELPAYKHVKEITITTEPLIKTTTQKVKRYQEMKKMELA